MLARETFNLLKKHHIRLDWRKGQNYLVNNQILSRIIENSQLNDSDVILEIGAGIGTLTIPLAENTSKVVAVEQDKRIVQVLKERLDNWEFPMWRFWRRMLPNLIFHILTK